MLTLAKSSNYKKLLILVIACTTFILGITMSLHWYGSHTYSDHFTVTLCELEQNPQFYNGKLVEVRGTLYSDIGGPYISDIGCNNEFFPLVDISGYDDLNPELRQWTQKIGHIDAVGEKLEVKVIIIGFFDAVYTESFDSSEHRFRIVPKEIRQISPFSVRRH